MKLNRSIKILALGAVVALNLITPAFADEAVDTSKRATSSQKLYSIQKTMGQRSMDPEQMKANLEKALENLNNAYEEGRIDQERYDAAKASIEDKLEKIENGDYSFMQETVRIKNMDPEQMKERLEKALEKLENAYEEEKIDQERYDASKANIEEKLEKIENGDYSFMQEPMVKRNVDPEQMKENLKKALERLENTYEEGKIDEERYEASKANIEENLEKIENGDYSFNKRPIEKRDIDPEQMQEMLEKALEKLENAYEDGKITEERYDAAKLHIEEKLEELDN